MESLLFLGIGFHNFDKYIIQELSLRYRVIYLNTMEFEQRYRPSCKLLNLINKDYVISLSRNIIWRKLKLLQNNSIDKIFVIKGTNLSIDHLNYIDKHNNVKEKVLYLWDKWENHNNIEEISVYFDRIYSFDSLDCKERGLHLRPLFYFRNQIKRTDNKTIDVSFVGGDHSDRYAFLREMKSICKENNWVYSINLLIGKIAFFKYKHPYFFASPYFPEDDDILVGNPLPYNQYVSIVSKSKVVVDMQVTGQTGLTMRTIEALAMGARLMTTNKSISEYKDIPNDCYLILNNNTSKEEIVEFVKRNTIENSWLLDDYECSKALGYMI